MNIIRERSVVSTHNPLSKLPLGSVTAKGWLRDQLLRSKAGMGGNLDKLEPDMIANPFISYSSFKEIFGGPADPTFAAGWSSEISGTFWMGEVELAFSLNDKELIDKVTTWVEGVLKHQEPDGYLGGYPAETTDRNADYNAWGSNWCYRALLAFYEATGRQDVLEAVHRGLLWFCKHWKEHKTEYTGSTIIESMIIVYAYTGDERLVRFSEDWLDWLENNSTQQNKISQYLSEKLPYSSMHTVAYGEDVKHPAIVWCATGEDRLLKASVNGMEKAVRKIVSPTGGAGSDGEYLSPVNAETEVEYCNFSTWNHSWSWMAMVTGEARWGDLMESCMFNGAQGARKKDERAIAYFTSPNQIKATKISATYSCSVDNEVYAPCFYVACCPVQSVRMIPEYVRGMCLTDSENGLYLFCYGPASVRSPRLELEMDTMYPFRDRITLKIGRADADAKLYLRIPAWCKAPMLKRGDDELALKAAEGGFVLVDAKVNSGDELTLTLPMEVEIKRLDDTDASARYPTYIERGPLLYSLPVPEKWEPYRGDPITPLPDDWSWYEVQPDLKAYNSMGLDPTLFPEEIKDFRRAPFGVAVDPELSAADVKVNEQESGYVWEEPPVTLEIPVKLAPYSYCSAMRRNFEPYGRGERETEGEAFKVRLVPYGCTNLRVTFFPREKK